MMTQSASFVVALALWPLSIVSATVLPLFGPEHFDVAITTTSLTDLNRLDPFAKDGRFRSLMVSAFRPITACQQKQLNLYMPPRTAAFQDEKYAAYGLPNGSFTSLQIETCTGPTSKRSCATSTTPLVLFSGALSTSRLIYTGMLQSIAAAGYIVISVDHPYDSDIVEFPNGTVITGLDISSDADIELALTTRVNDLTFVYEQMSNATVANKLFPHHRIGRRNLTAAVLGHSFGGAAAASTMLREPSFVAGLNLDGSMFGSVLEAGLDRPFMLMGHENKTQETDPSWKAIWPRLTGWKEEFEVKQAAHYSFSDLPFITAVLDLQDKLPAEVGQVLGTVEGHHMMKLMVTYATSFLDMVFKKGSGEALIGGNDEFPEVVAVA